MYVRQKGDLNLLMYANAVAIDDWNQYARQCRGTVIDMVQGIYEQRTRGYRIQLRDNNDISVATPPNINDAYPIADNQIRVVFDRNVTPA